MHVFLIPTAIAIASIFGLIAALLGDGWHDVIAWLALGVPVGAVAWAMVVRRA